jgi:hypothetical protein
MPEAKDGKYARKLRFAPETISQAEHINGAPLTRHVKLTGNAAIAYGHKKIFQVEKENVGVEAAHHSEFVQDTVT